jgi:hypothetical protein
VATDNLLSLVFINPTTTKLSSLCTVTIGLQDFTEIDTGFRLLVKTLFAYLFYLRNVNMVIISVNIMNSNKLRIEKQPTRDALYTVT